MTEKEFSSTEVQEVVETINKIEVKVDKVEKVVK